MKLLLKLLFVLINLILMLLIWICARILHCTAFLFGMAGTLVAILGVAVLLTYSVQNGIILLIIAFAVSPLGLPMLVAWFLGKLQAIRLRSFDKTRLFS